MNNTPKISIIVPVYNVDKHLGKCIESVLSQTYKDWELILVDDGSTDNSGKICDEYALKDKRIKVIHKENEGVTATRDRGVKEAQGEFLFFIDGDDYITENALELFIEKQKENDADLVRGDFLLCDINGNDIKNNIPQYDFNNKFNWLICVIEEGGYICNNLIKRNLYIKSSDISNRIRISEDLLISFNLFEHLNSVSKLNYTTYIYIQHSNSACHSSNSSELRIRIKNESILLVTEGISVIRTKHKNEFDINHILKRIDLFLLNKILCVFFQQNFPLKNYKSRVFKLYLKFYVFNIKVQFEVLKKSWKCFLYNWFSITKFIK